MTRLAGWCSWRCPVLCFTLAIAANLPAAPTWWRVVCNILVAVLIALAFTSFGLSLACTAILVKRKSNPRERVGVLLGVAGGAALVYLGLLGASAIIYYAVPTS